MRWIIYVVLSWLVIGLAAGLWVGHAEQDGLFWSHVELRDWNSGPIFCIHGHFYDTDNNTISECPEDSRILLSLYQPVGSNRIFKYMFAAGFQAGYAIARPASSDIGSPAEWRKHASAFIYRISHDCYAGDGDNSNPQETIYDDYNGVYAKSLDLFGATDARIFSADDYARYAILARNDILKEGTFSKWKSHTTGGPCQSIQVDKWRR